MKLNINDEYTLLEGKIDEIVTGGSYGLLCKKGRVPELNLDTAGRTRIVFGRLTSENTFTYDIADVMGYTYRAYVIYTDHIGNQVVEYSEPIFA